MEWLLKSWCCVRARVYVRACVRARVRACARACARACVRAGVRARACVRACVRGGAACATADICKVCPSVTDKLRCCELYTSVALRECSAQVFSASCSAGASALSKLRCASATQKYASSLRAALTATLDLSRSYECTLCEPLSRC